MAVIEFTLTHYGVVQELFRRRAHEEECEGGAQEQPSCSLRCDQALLQSK